jgi:hypothetical protein
MGSFGREVALKQNLPEKGDNVLVEWANENGTARGMSKGMFVGAFQGAPSTEYLVLEFDPFLDEFTSKVLCQTMLRFDVIPANMVRKIDKLSGRKSLPFFEEKFTDRVEVHFRSNIDFEATWERLRKRADCKADKPLKPGSEAEYQIVLKRIKMFEDAAITIFANGALQVKCKFGQLDDIIEWVKDAVDLLPDHRRLVLFETSHKYSIWDTRKEGVHPSEEVIEGLAKLEKGPPVLHFWTGWTYTYLQDSPENFFKIRLPQLWPLDKFLIPEKITRKRV